MISKKGAVCCCTFYYLNFVLFYLADLVYLLLTTFLIEG